MLAVSALTFTLGTLAVVLPGAGESGATAAGPPARWQPAPDARWQYQLESSNRRLASTGGISVGICEVPHSGGGCVHPDAFDIDLNHCRIEMDRKPARGEAVVSRSFKGGAQFANDLPQ